MLIRPDAKCAIFPDADLELRAARNLRDAAEFSAPTIVKLHHRKIRLDFRTLQLPRAKLLVIVRLRPNAAVRLGQGE